MKPSWKWNSSSSTLFIELYWYIPLLLSPTGKIAVSFAKRSSSSYKQTFTRFSRGKSPFLSANSTLFKLYSRPFGLPQCVAFSSLGLFGFPFRPWRPPVPLLLSNVWTLSSLHLCLHSFFVLLLYGPASSGLASTRRSVFLHAMVVWPISRLILQLIDKHHLLERRYKTKHQILTTERLFHKKSAWCVSCSE